MERELLYDAAVSLISPLTTAVAAGSVSLGLAALKRPKASFVIGLFAVVWITVWSTPLASYAIRRSLESSYPELPLSVVPVRPAIVLLGGGLEVSELVWGSPNFTEQSDRIWYAAKLFRAGKSPLILVSGKSDSAATKQVLIEMGVPSQSIATESCSTSTYENAAYSERELAHRGIKDVLLVTSALHMDRALRLFTNAGLRPFPAPTDHEVRLWRPYAFLLDARALDGSARALKELLGDTFVRLNNVGRGDVSSLSNCSTRNK